MFQVRVGETGEGGGVGGNKYRVKPGERSSPRGGTLAICFWQTWGGWTHLLWGGDQGGKGEGGAQVTILGVPDLGGSEELK